MFQARTTSTQVMTACRSAEIDHQHWTADGIQGIIMGESTSSEPTNRNLCVLDMPWRQGFDIISIFEPRLTRVACFALPFTWLDRVVSREHSIACSAYMGSMRRHLRWIYWQLPTWFLFPPDVTLYHYHTFIHRAATLPPTISYLE